MRFVGRVAVYVLAFLTLPLGIGAVGLQGAFDAYLAPSSPSRVGAEHIPEPPAIDPEKPTVAVVLGKDITEVADALAPYAVFQRSGAFNVVMVAEQRRPVALTGGLDLLPHYSFAELDAQAGGGPALIVVPNVPNVGGNETLRLWVQRHGHEGSLVMSVCSGAAMLAATGLADGQRATTHWGDIAGIESQYPAVTWVRGERYIDNGKVITTAGILSGVDGSLHMIDRLRGRALALDVARQMHYADVRFLDNPSIAQFRVGPADAIILLNAAYLWDRPTLGVALYDGIDEVALAAVYDTYGIVDRLLSLAPQGTVVTTRHGLNLFARRAPDDWSASREILVPGRKASPTIAWLAPFDV
ncbi:MAG: Transcriptional regulator GlxA family, contains an amidase domain and an AraC-type DNA-binding, partial [Myxococcales bacterium]|nr:Transcriptional regulator GlxA family, contains an amidase domain and an AraC-type DNA-binding [Myxococcales bacterium]